MKLNDAQKNNAIILLNFGMSVQEVSDKLEFPIEYVEELQNKQLIFGKNLDEDSKDTKIYFDYGIKIQM